MGDKSVETLCFFGFPVSRICLFPVQHWKGGGGVGSQSKPDLKWNKWNVAISTWFSQLSQLLLSPIVATAFYF